MPKTLNLRKSMHAEQSAVTERLQKANTPLTKPVADAGAEDEAQKRRYEIADRLFGASPATEVAHDNAPQSHSDSKVVRDTLTLVPEDRALIDNLQLRCWKQNLRLNKSEIFRLALRALDRVDLVDLQDLAASMPRVAKGRPPKKIT